MIANTYLGRSLFTVCHIDMSIRASSPSYNFLTDGTCPTGRDGQSLSDLVPADMHIRGKNPDAGRYASRRKTRARGSSKFSKHEVSVLFAREHFPAGGRAGGKGDGRRVCIRHVRMYTSCILLRTNAPSSASLCPKGHSSDRSISYLPIKGRRFVQFILNHATVTGCQ